MRFPTALMLLTLMVGCREFPNPYDPANNRPPDFPANPVPTHGANRQDTVGLTLRWTCADPDSAVGDTLLYDLYFGIAEQPPRVASDLPVESWDCAPLAVGATYYWRIVARDARGDTTAGPVWSFTTNPNLAPFAPSAPRPDDGRNGLPAGILLSWQGGDPNPGDSVVYDLYLGPADPPPLAARDLAETEWLAAGLTHNTRYYWRVVARDQDGAETEGPVWSFTTMARVEFSSPAGGEQWRVGSLQTVRWSGGTDSGTETFIARGLTETRESATGKPELRKRGLTGSGGPPLARAAQAGSDSTVLYHSADGGTSWHRVGLVTTPGEYRWTVAGPPAADARVEVRVYVGRDTERAASASFMTYAMLMPVTVITPAAGELWRVGERRTITWEGGGSELDSTVIEHSTDNGQTWVRHGRATEPNRYEWDVPGPESESARVRVRAHLGADEASGISGRFRTFVLDPVVITSPAAGERWRMLTYQFVRWSGGTRLLDSAVVAFRPDTGSSWQREGVTLGDSLLWLVPANPTEQAQFRVQVWRLGRNETGLSTPFAIYDTALPSQPVITSPAGGERWQVGTEQDITWTGGTDGMDSTVVLFSTNDGATWLRQGMTRQPGYFRWTVPDLVTDQARIGLQAFCMGRSAEALSNRFRVTGTVYPDTVIATVLVGSEPVALAWNERDQRLYVANRAAGTVSVIDGASNSVIATVTAGSLPRALAWDSVRNKVYVVNEGDRSVTVIDGADHRVIASVPVGAAPCDIALNAAGGRVYVANFGTGANSATVIDATADTVIATVPCGFRPRALAWNPVNNRVYVACQSGNSVTVFDGATNEVVDTVRVQRAPLALVVVEDQNHIYVANRDDNTVSVIDGATNTIIATVSVGAMPTALAWNRAAEKVYVTNENHNSVSVIRTTNRQVVAVVGVGGEPSAALWLPGANMAYIACRGSGETAIINGNTNALERLLRVGSEPVALTRNAAGTRVYAVNRAAGTVSVIGIE